MSVLIGLIMVMGIMQVHDYIRLAYINKTRTRKEPYTLNEMYETM